MKKFFLRLLKPFIKRRIKKLINDDNYKLFITKKLNEKLDIPKLDEEEELKLLNSMYDALQEISLELIDNICEDKEK